MEAKDFRIGNYIDVKCIDPILSGIDYFQPQELNINNLRDLIDGCDDFLYRLIPITEEWLLKFGARKVNSGYENFVEYHIDYYFVIRVYISNGNISVFIKSEDDPYCETNLEHINYVHQLQNIYYLTLNEELTIK